MTPSVAIVGAGISGVITCRVFQQYGFDVHAFEKMSDVGGVWESSRSYPGLKTQTSKYMYNYSDMKMPKQFDRRPRASQIREYLNTYVDKYGLRELISFNSEITKISQDDSKWQVETTRTDSGEKGTITCDYLVVCNGIYSKPNMPHFQGQQQFKEAGGSMYHSSDQIPRHTLQGKHVIVVGYGRSANDLAVDMTKYSAASVSVVARKIRWKMPERWLGLVDAQTLGASRLMENLNKYIRPRGFAKIMHGRGAPLRDYVGDVLANQIVRQQRLKQLGLVPIKELVINDEVAIESKGFHDGVAKKLIKVYRETQIVQLEPGKAILTDGTQLPAHVIICGTGWHRQVAFMDSPIKEKIFAATGDFILYRNLIPLGLDNVGLNGYNCSTYSQFTAEMGAVWLAELFTGGFKAPSLPEMRRDAEEQLDWSRTRTCGCNRGGTTIAPFNTNYIDELLEDMGVEMGKLETFKEWFLAIDPCAYTKLRVQLLTRYEKERKTTFLGSV